MKYLKSQTTLEHDKARKLFYNAKRSGKIVQVRFCQECGGTGTEAHHQDYSKPLAVRWLCESCHKKADVRDGTNGLVVYRQRIKMNKQFFVEFGKKGSDKRWANRYNCLKELARKYNRDRMEWFRNKWTTEQLLELLKYIKQSGK